MTLIQSIPKWIYFALIFLGVNFTLVGILLLYQEGVTLLSILSLGIGFGSLGALFRPLQYCWLILATCLSSLVALGILIWDLTTPFNYQEYLDILFVAYLVALSLSWLILYTLYQFHIQERDLEETFQSLNQSLKETFIFQKNSTLSELSEHSVLLIIFLRYLNCTFCRQTLANIKKNKEALEKKGFQIILIHSDTPKQARQLFKHYGLEDVIQVSDPSRRIYRAFGLHRVSLFNLIHPTMLKQFIQSTLIEGHSQGLVNGDIFQRPGVFIISKNQLIYAFYPAHIGNQVDYNEISNLNDVDRVLQFMAEHAKKV